MSEEPEYHNAWKALRIHTRARIGIGRTGSGIPVKESLEFRLAHAHARDAVYSKLDTEKLTASLVQFKLPILHLESRANYRELYLQRPDLGRLLDDASAQQLQNHVGQTDIAVIIADGLSAYAVNSNAVLLLEALLPMLTDAKLTVAPIALVEHGRVAVGDVVASILNAKLSLMLIGERPGLSSSDSMGAYLTYNPKPGLTDEARNCVSNIRPEGLPYDQAARKLYNLIQQAFRRKLSGVQLKDNTATGYFP
ncbi:ethanolamine ammonia-lyase subunit EutC [Mucilaginibacter limnophilus]|uniref:Ethanolamine ammonia-lyase small subunit n=1 Tax=Mucilaginibacter limnophilus TaxID=1932778 RepID=A0A437MTN4_9SPHI|nr:ethanolamine ammonia-lyase subunit EutC [Mucilaginibacter limnophilus]RVU01026.1 ethanolamine ammonia-lyase subunit EutC [Mucilaginibacter limnophilus]